MFDYELRKRAENKQWKDRTLSEHLAMDRAERPDEWRMDEFIRMAKELEDHLSTIAQQPLSGSPSATPKSPQEISFGGWHLCHKCNKLVNNGEKCSNCGDL